SVEDDQLRDIELEHPLDDQGDRPALHRLASEGMAVVALSGNAEEERSGPDGARVVGEVEDLDRSALHDVRGGERGDDALQVHLRGESTIGLSRHRRRPRPKRLGFAAVSSPAALDFETRPRFMVTSRSRSPGNAFPKRASLATA